MNRVKTLRYPHGTLRRQLDMRRVRLAYKRRAALRMVRNGASALPATSSDMELLREIRQIYSSGQAPARRQR